ncbi:MAG: hypothetical protein KC910_26260, partial [Candidatus Eremiobacteraeota bacterium]|nr:hypothetical protein [Candidatus Eremiobacteraeota bacterium]
VLYARPEELERHDGVEAALSRYQLGAQPYAGDFLLVYLIAQRREELERIDQLYDQGRFRQARLILALPMRSYNFAAESNRLAALERMLEGHPPYSDPTTRAHQQALEAHAAARAKLDESLRLYLSPEYLEFRHQNEIKRLLDGGTFIDYLHELLEQQIGSPPVVPHRQFASLVDSTRNQQRRRQALDYLLATRGPLLLYHTGRPLHQALHRGLIETGLVEASSQGATRSSYVPAGLPTSRLGRLFRDLRERFLGQPRLEVSFASLVDELLHPPHCLAPATIELVMAALLWSFEGRLQLWGNRPTLFTDAAMLGAAVAAPSGHRLVYERWSPSLETFLAGLTQQFGLPPETSEHRLVRELLSWYRGLPEAAVAIGRDKTNEAEWLVELLEHPVEDPAEFLSVALPRALGLPLEDPETLLVYLAETQRTLEEAVGRTRSELNAKLRELFAANGAELEQPWPSLVARWCARLPRESADSPMADLGHLLATYSATTTDEDETLEDLLYELDYGPVDRWRQNYTDEVLARVREVKSVLEHAPFQGLYPLEAGQQRQAARRLIAWLARQSGLGPEAFKERSLSL